MKQDWSKWLGVDLENMNVTSNAVSDVASRMHVLKHLKEGNKVLDSVNHMMEEITHERSTLVYTHPLLSWDANAALAIDGLASDITSITDTGRWPTSWEGNSLKTMAVVLTAFATSLNTDFKSLVTIIAKGYSNTFGEYAMVEAIKTAPGFAQQFIMGTVLSLNLSEEQMSTWRTNFDKTMSPEPQDVIRSFFAMAKPPVPNASQDAPTI